MGHCYDFGVTVVAGCRHAMAVGPDGGACECRACAAHCTGRFRACAGILAIPGYVPSAAPRWALRSANPRAGEWCSGSDGIAAGAVPARSRPDPAGTQPGSADSDPGNVTPGRVIDLVAAETRKKVTSTATAPTVPAHAPSEQDLAPVELRREPTDRDTDLARTLERVANAYDSLAERLEADRRERLALVDLVGQFTRWLTSLELPAGQGGRWPSRVATVVGGTAVPEQLPAALPGENP